MNTFGTLYDVATGRVLQHVTYPPGAKLTFADGVGLLEGVHVEPDTHRVVGGAAVPLAEEEVAGIAKARARQDAVARIQEIESTQHRALRELIVDPNNAAARAKLSAIDDEIAVLRAQL